MQLSTCVSLSRKAEYRTKQFIILKHKILKIQGTFDQFTCINKTIGTLTVISRNNIFLFYNIILTLLWPKFQLYIL